MHHHCIIIILSQMNFTGMNDIRRVYSISPTEGCCLLLFCAYYRPQEHSYCIINTQVYSVLISVNKTMSYICIEILTYGHQNYHENTTFDSTPHTAIAGYITSLATLYIERAGRHATRVVESLMGLKQPRALLA